MTGCAHYSRLEIETSNLRWLERSRRVGKINMAMVLCTSGASQHRRIASPCRIRCGRSQQVCVIAVALALYAIVVATAASMTSDEELELISQSRHYSALLDKIFVAAAPFWKNCTTDTQTDLGSTTANMCNAAAVAEANLTFIPERYGTTVPVDLNQIGVKLVAGSDAQDPRVTCLARKISEQMQANLRNDVGDSRGALRWQYFAAMDDGSHALYPFVNWRDLDECPGTYVPMQRPWFTFGLTGSNAVIILIDTNSADGYEVATRRLRAEVDAAVRVLSLLGSWDFFNIIVYSDAPQKYRVAPSRSTNSQKALAIRFLRNLTVSQSPISSVSAALANVAKVFNTLPRMVCTVWWVILSDNRDDTFTDQVSQRLPSEGQNALFIFPVVFDLASPANRQPLLPVFKHLACVSRGLHTVVHSENEVSNVTLRIIRYFSSVTTSNTPQWSEVYEDAFGQGMVTTAVKPLVVPHRSGEVGATEVLGMLAVDIKVSDLSKNGTIPTEDIAVVLGQSAVCPTYDLSYQSLFRATEGASALCSKADVDAFSTEHAMLPLHEATHRLEFVLSVIATFFLFLFPFLHFRFLSQERCTAGAVIIFFLLLFSSLVTLIAWLGFVSEPTIVAENWVKTSMVVTESRLEQRNCCQTICGNAMAPCGLPVSPEQEAIDGPLPSCAEVALAEEQGPCDAGYQCCLEQSYSCACRHEFRGSELKKVCDLCKRCVAAISRTNCTSMCDSCYEAVVLFTYNVNGIPVSGSLRQSCFSSVQLQACLEFLQPFPKGLWRSLHYNPNSVGSVKFSVEFDPRYIAMLVVGLVVLLGTIAVVIFRVVVYPVPLPVDEFSSVAVDDDDDDDGGSLSIGGGSRSKLGHLKRGDYSDSS